MFSLSILSKDTPPEILTQKALSLYPQPKVRRGERNDEILGKNLLHDVRWFYAGEPMIETLVFERQLLVVDAQTV